MSQLAQRVGVEEGRSGVSCDVERLFKSDQACALAAATAHEFNNELTVILSGVSALIDELGPEHPARVQALDVQNAARRCARKTSGLLRFGTKRGNRTGRMTLERLMQED